MLGGGSLHLLGDILSSFRRPCGRLLQPRIVASSQGSDCAGPMKGCRLGCVRRTAQRGWKGEGDLCQELDNPGGGNRGGGGGGGGGGGIQRVCGVTICRTQ